MPAGAVAEVATGALGALTAGAVAEVAAVALGALAAVTLAAGTFPALWALGGAPLGTRWGADRVGGSAIVSPLHVGLLLYVWDLPARTEKAHAGT
jgi:hypothetical protein